jgi:hypothetical protein
MLDVRPSARDGPVAQRLEQGTHNSRMKFCARFHCVAQHRGYEVIQPFSIRSALHRIALFCSQKSSERRKQP